MRNTPQYAIVDPLGVLRYVGAIDDKRTSAVATWQARTTLCPRGTRAGLAGKPM